MMSGQSENHSMVAGVPPNSMMMSNTPPPHLVPASKTTSKSSFFFHFIHEEIKLRNIRFICVLCSVLSGGIEIKKMKSI